MAGRDRMLAVLDLFSPEQPLLTAEEMSGSLGCSTATTYRYVARLCAAGLLARFRGAYALGPRIIELDHTIRLGDPLLHAAQAVMAELRDATGCDMQIVSMVGDRILVVHHERGSEPGMVSFVRGLAMPLFRGAGSRALVANLPTPRQKRLYTANRAEAAASGLGADWAEFRAAMEAVRRAGHTLSLGELQPGNIGVAAAIMAEGVLPAALVLVLSTQRFATTDRKLVADMVMDAARRITAALDGNAPPGATRKRGNE
jgi:DNA-binding IclR family transcriptional regulator